MSQEGKPYPATAAHPSLGEAAVTGQLFAAEFALKFESARGALELPYDGTNIAFGTKQDPRVTFTNEAAPDCVFTANNEDILQELVFRRNRHLRPQLEVRREHVEGVRRLLLTGGFFLAFVSLSALLGAAVEWALPRLIEQVPVKFEQELGDEEAAKARKRMKLSAETNVTAQLNALVARLTKAQPKSPYEFRVTLIEGPPNAYALPGGNLFVTTGLLRLCTNSMEVCGILAHEVAHVTRRHGLRTMVTTIGPARAMQTVLGNHHGFLRSLTENSHRLVSMSFSRDFEREADEGGFDLMLAANLDPRGLEQGLKRLQSFYGHNRGARAQMSHPPTPERIERLAAKWTATPKQTGFATLEPLKLAPLEKRGSPVDKRFQ